MSSRSGPLRPSLQRANVSTQSVPNLESTNATQAETGRRRPSTSTAKIAALNAAVAASTNSSPMNTPLRVHQGHYFDNGHQSTTDMLRTESNDTHRSLKSKSSRKELKELARSATPNSLSFGHEANTSSMFYSSKQAKGGHSVSEQSRSTHDDDDDDARSISSFTCSFSSEFDRQARMSAITGAEDRSSRQGWLDAAFTKLSQKSGVRRHAPHLKGTNAMPTIKDVDSVSPTTSGRKASAHFLDFSAIISPLPRLDKDSLLAPPSQLGASGTNITPRPIDYSRFPPPTSPYAAARSMDDQEDIPIRPAHPQQPLLRARRSEDSLTMRRRTQRQQQQLSPNAAFMDMPLVPMLPGWAQTENEALRPAVPGRHGAQPAGLATMRMARTVSHDVSRKHAAKDSTGSGSMDMQRAVSHDAASALQLSFGPPLTSNFDSWHADEAHTRQHRPLSPTTSTSSYGVRSQSAMDHHAHHHHHSNSYGSPTMHTKPLSSQQAPMMLSMHALNRGSVSSAASDSDMSSHISSVPQTPVSHVNTLPGVGVNGFYRRESQNSHSQAYYDIDPIMENDSAIAMREKYEHSHHFSPPVANLMNPRSSSRTGHRAAQIVSGHESSVQYQSERSASVASVASALFYDDAEAAQRTIRRPRAATTSSTSRPSLQSIRPKEHELQMAHSASATKTYESRTMSRQASVSSASDARRDDRRLHRRTGSGDDDSLSTRRTSTVSNTSAGTSSSSGSSSTSSVLLSYIRSGFSKSQSNLASLPESHSKASTASTVTPASAGIKAQMPSPTKRNVTAEQMANSIGRKFGRSIAATANRNV